MSEEPQYASGDMQGDPSQVAQTMEGNPPVSTEQYDRAQAEKLLQNGLDNYDREDLEGAIECYYQALQADPTYGLAYNNLGMVFIDVEQYDQAIEALYNSISLNPEYGESFSNLGFAYRRLGRDLEAAIAYNRFLELEPDVEEEPRIREWLMQVCQAAGYPEPPPFQYPQMEGEEETQEQAAQGYEAGIPSDEMVTLAAVPALGDYTEPPAGVQPGIQAEAMAQTAPEPESPAEAPAAEAPPQADEPPPEEEPQKIKKMSGWEAASETPATAAALSATGDFIESPPDAESSGTDVVEFKDNEMMDQGGAASGMEAAPASPQTMVEQQVERGSDPMELIERAMDQFAEGEMEAAEQSFRQVVAVHPELSEAHTGIGKVLVRLENHEGGMDALRNAIRLDPKDPAPYFVLGFSLRAQGLDVEAAKIYRNFLKLYPAAEDAKRISEWIKHVQSESGEPLSDSEPQSEGEAEGKGEAEQKPEIPEASENDPNYKKAMSAFQDGDMDAALRGCVKVLNEDAGHYRARVLLGRAYLRQSQYEQAIEQLEGALVTCPDFPEGLYFLGQAFEKSGQTERAKESYQTCIELAPSGPRSDQLRVWISNHKTDEKKSDSQIQCELCLRYFGEESITDHEGKQTCKGCLSLLRDGPEVSDEDRASAGKEIGSTATMSEEELAPPKRKSRGMILAAVFVGVLILLAVGVTVLEEYLVDETEGPETDPTGNRVHGGVKPPPKVPQYDWTKVVLATDEPARVLPYSYWTFNTKLSGLKNAPKDTAVVYRLVKGPVGMTMNAQTGELIWNPQPKTFDTLLSGFRLKVNLEVTGTQPGKPPKEVFKRSRELFLHYQFGFLPKEPISLQLHSGDRVLLQAGEFSGDKFADLLFGSGQFGSGSLRILNGGGDAPFSEAQEIPIKGSLSALQVLDINVDKRMDLITANRFSGEVKTYLRTDKGLEFTAGSTFGRGIVGMSVSHQGADKRLDVAVLSGLGRRFSVASVNEKGVIGKPESVRFPVGGPRVWIFPWQAKGRGSGWIVITPLGQKAIWFVPVVAGKPSTPIPFELKISGVVVGATPRIRDDGTYELHVLVNEEDEAVLFSWQDADGALQPVAGVDPLRMKDLALSLTAADLNQDKKPDLIIAYQEGVSIFLAHANSFVQGPEFKELGQLTGAVCPVDMNLDLRPDILLMTRERQLYVLQSHFSKIIKSGGDAGQWPDSAEVTQVDLGPVQQHPTKAFGIQLPKAFVATVSKKKGVDFIVLGAKDAEGKNGRIEISILEGAPKPMDAATLKEMKKGIPGLTWVGKPLTGKLGKAMAIRAEALAPATKNPKGPKRHLIWYVAVWKGRYVKAFVEASQEGWQKNRLLLEACARSLKPTKKASKKK